MNTSETLVPRDPTACTRGKQWYVCTVGNYRGCCSSDPCTTGICPDDDENVSTASTKSATSGTVNNSPSSTLKTETLSETKLTETTLISEGSSMTGSTLTASSTGAHAPTTAETSQPPVSLPTTGSSTATDTVTQLTATDNTALSSVLAATQGQPSASSTPVTSTNTASLNRGAIIGGVLGGVAALALLAILIFWCLRRRKYGKPGKKTRANSRYPWGPVQVRANISEIDGKPFRSVDEANSRQLTLSKSNADTSKTAPNKIPSTATPSSASGVHLTPDLVLNSSLTNLLSHSPLKPQLPPTPSLPASFYPSASISQEFTSELQDTGFQPPRAELASHPQSEWINVPLDQRSHQNSMRGRPGPAAWRSPSLTPVTGSPVRGRSSLSHTRTQSDGCGSTSPHVERVVTTEGVILGANLDRYSSGNEIARSLHQGALAESRAENHVMSFMQFSGRAEDGGLAAGHLHTSSSRDERSGEGSTLSRLETRVDDSTFDDGVEGDVPPAYEAGAASLEPEIKSPSGRMGMSLRGV